MFPLTLANPYFGSGEPFGDFSFPVGNRGSLRAAASDSFPIRTLGVLVGSDLLVGSKLLFDLDFGSSGKQILRFVRLEKITTK